MYIQMARGVILANSTKWNCVGLLGAYNGVLGPSPGNFGVAAHQRQPRSAEDKRRTCYVALSAGFLCVCRQFGTYCRAPADDHSFHSGVQESLEHAAELHVHRPGRARQDLTLESCAQGAPEEVESIFYSSVLERTVSNAQLRRFISHLRPGQHALALAAVNGVRRAGLRLNALTHEVLLEHLIASGQLKASMALHEEMMRTHMLPTSRTYALMMELCLERGAASSCEKLFQDMQKKGMRPSIRNYELLISAYAETSPPQWEKAIAVFDKISTLRHLHPSAETYNALLRVYLNMRPFDWRVVYNCYYELRHHDPPIKLEWESYELVRAALTKGNAGWFRRLSTFCDAWLTITPMFTVQWMKGVMVYLVLMIIFKSIISTLITAVLTAAGSVEKTSSLESKGKCRFFAPASVSEIFTPIHIITTAFYNTTLEHTMPLANGLAFGAR
eukprot:gene9189-6466_t